jgi:beta-mannosidase
MTPATLSATLRRDAAGWVLDLSADRFAQSIAIEAEGFLPSDSWFHLAPGGVKTIRLASRAGTDPAAKPTGEIRGPAIEAVVSF